MPTELLLNIQKALKVEPYNGFKDLLKNQNYSVEDAVPEDLIWQAFYEADPQAFFKFVLPQQANQISRVILGTKPKTETVYLAADRIIAASSAFAKASADLKKLAAAWDIVIAAETSARKTEQEYLKNNPNNTNSIEAKVLRENTKKYEAGAKQVFYNVLSVRAKGFQIMTALYNDPNIARRNKRIKKYLFRAESDKIFARLSKKLDKLDNEGLRDINLTLKKRADDIVETIREKTIPQVKGKSFISRKAASLVNFAARSSVETAVNNFLVSPGLEEKKQQSQDMLPEDYKFIDAADALFGLNDDTLKFREWKKGKTIDINNMQPEDITFYNLRTTAQKKISSEVIAHPSVDKGKRALRIVAAVGAVILAIVSVALIITFPPSLPFVIGADVVLALAGGSLMYFSRDPLPAVAKRSNSVFANVIERIADFLAPKPKPQFDMPDSSKDFLKNLDPDLVNLLKEHFEGRADSIKQQLEGAPINQAQFNKGNIKQDLDELSEDWQQILSIANIASKNQDQTQFVVAIKGYLKDSYTAVERPQYIELAKRKKILWDNERQREDLGFNDEKIRIEELTKIAEKLNSITPST